MSQILTSVPQILISRPTRIFAPGYRVHIYESSQVIILSHGYIGPTVSILALHPIYNSINFARALHVHNNPVVYETDYEHPIYST